MTMVSLTLILILILSLLLRRQGKYLHVVCVRKSGRIRNALKINPVLQDCLRRHHAFHVPIDEESSYVIEILPDTLSEWHCHRACEYSNDCSLFNWGREIPHSNQYYYIG